MKAMKGLLAFLLLLALPSCGGSEVGRYQWVDSGPGGYKGILDTETGVFFGNDSIDPEVIDTFRLDLKTKRSVVEMWELIEEREN